MLKKKINSLISFVLCISILFSTTGCSGTVTESGLSDPNPKVITEDVIVEETIIEDTIIEDTRPEFITSEVYLNEVVLAENIITERLLEEKTIDEVLLCQTIYVSEDGIEEFSANSCTAPLFGPDVKIGPLLKKVTVGAGVIVTLVILKKHGFPEPIASIAIAAADKSIVFAGWGAGIGSLFGGFTGAANEIDSTGRTSAIMGFALATVGLVLSTISLVGEIPSGGSTTITLATGIKLVIAGVSTLTAAGFTAKTGYDAVKTFTSTDSQEIDWNNIDWERVGISAAQQAVKNGADGFMWGAIVGAVYGGADGYDYYHKFGTPYSSRKDRYDKTPVNGGHWSGERGDSDFILDDPLTLPDGRTVTQITYRNGVPDFSPFEEAQVNIPNMTDNRKLNFGNADEVLAEYWSKIKYKGKSWTPREISEYRTNNKLTWHEMNNMESMQLVPYDVNNTFGHLGGVSEYKAMIGQKGVALND